MGDDPLTRLADIELPAPPHWQPLLTGIAAALVAFALALWLGLRLWRRYRADTASPPQRALAQIDGLLGDWRHGHIDDREASYRLAALLRLGLGLEQLDVHCPAALSRDKLQWGHTVAALQHLRYEATPAMRLHEEEFVRVKEWISAAAAHATPEPSHSS